MASFTLPKGKTTLLVMDCQNDVIHEEGKGARLLSGGGVARIVKESR